MIRKRPMFWLGLSFALGIALQPGDYAFLVLGVVTLGALMLRSWLPKQGVQWFVCLLSVVLGWGYAEIRWQQLPVMLDECSDQKKGMLQGRISGFPKRQEEDWVLLVEHAIFDDGQDVWPLSGAIQLRLYADEDFYADEPRDVVRWQPGDTVQVQAKLSAIRAGSNFGDPDWTTMYRRKGVTARASGSIASAIMVDRNEQSLQVHLWKVRQWAVSVYRGQPAEWMERNWAELLAGLTIGSTEQLPEEWDSAFRDAGLIHLLVVSGGHFALLIVLLRRLLRLIPMPLVVERCLMALAIIAYTALTGAQESIVRAGIMALLMLLAEVHWRRTEWPSLLVLSMVLMLLQNPFALFSAGFQLSYVAVAGLCLWTHSFTTWLDSFFQAHVPKQITLILAGTMAAQLAVLPLGISLFNQISLIAPLSNVLCSGLVVPIQALAIALLALHPLGGGGFLSPMLVQGVQYLLRLLVWLAERTASLPGAVWNVAAPPAWLIVFVYTWMLFCTYSSLPWFNRRLKTMATVLLCAFLMIWVAHPWPYQLELVAIDVGQGDALFLRMPNGRTVLIDGGGAATYTSDVGTKVVLPFLRRQGIQKLDVALITHAHEDHYQGVLQVYDRFPVAYLAGPAWESSEQLPEQLRVWLQAKDPPYLTLRTGSRLLLDDSVCIDVYSANPHNERVTQQGVNNTSIVLRVQYGQTVLWLTGDAEAGVEQALVQQGIRELGYAVALKVGHHGSSTSSSAEWLEALSPQVAVISAGRNNSYGHPTADVLKRLEQQNCLVRRTDLHGGIRLQSNGVQWRVENVFAKRVVDENPVYARRDLHCKEDFLRQWGIWCYDLFEKRRFPTA